MTSYITDFLFVVLHMNNAYVCATCIFVFAYEISPKSEIFNVYVVLGNSNLVYTIIRKRTIFHQLANLPTDHSSIAKALTKRSRKSVQSGSAGDELPSMEGSVPASEAEPGTLKATLAATPGNLLLYSTTTRFSRVCILFILHIFRIIVTRWGGPGARFSKNLRKNPKFCVSFS